VNEKEKIFCPVRKGHFILTPEEKVRQKVLTFLYQNKSISYSRMAVERQIGKSKKRFDIVVHEQSSGKPILLIECKRESEKLKQSVFDQISSYNQELNVPYLIITNWTNWMAAQIEGDNYTFLDSFPEV